MGWIGKAGLKAGGSDRSAAGRNKVGRVSDRNAGRRGKERLEKKQYGRTQATHESRRWSHVVGQWSQKAKPKAEPSTQPSVPPRHPAGQVVTQLLLYPLAPPKVCSLATGHWPVKHLTEVHSGDFLPPSWRTFPEGRVALAVSSS